MDIDITGIDLVKFVKEVYKLSLPAGLGRLHFREGGLTNGEAEEILGVWKDDKQFALDMDYVGGRACKMAIFREGKKLFIKAPWYDHTDMRLKVLLKMTWPKDKPFPGLKTEEHGIGCHCMHCRIKRRIQV